MDFLKHVFESLLNDIVLENVSLCRCRMSSSSSQDIINDVPSPTADSMIESSMHSSSDEDSSNKQDINQMLEPSTESSVFNAHAVVLEEEPLGEEFTESSAALVNIISPMDVEDVKQDEDSPAISFDTTTTTPVLTCQVTSDSSTPPNTLTLSISNNVGLVKHSDRASNDLSKKTSAGSVSSHHVSFFCPIISDWIHQLLKIIHIFY